MGKNKGVYQQSTVDKAAEFIRFVPLSDSERGVGLIRLGPFMLVITKEAIKDVPKEAHGL